MSVSIRLAQLSDLERLACLFDGYRCFYEQPSDVSRARAFLCDRLVRRDSVLLVACVDAAAPVGFVQLYPSFSSVSMRPIFILNDLFVAPEARRTGVARCLLRAAREHARSGGAVRVSLTTAIDNLPAQRLYESVGYRWDEVFKHYDLQLPPTA